jgi:hypothetical protein
MTKLATALDSGAGGLGTGQGIAVDMQGTMSQRPSAGVAGRYFYATDTGILYRDTGSTWTQVSPDGLHNLAGVSATNIAISSSVLATIGTWTGPTDSAYLTATASGLIVQQPGMYLLSGTVRWDTGTTGRRFMDLSRNTTAVNGAQFASGGSQATALGRADSYTTMVLGSAGDRFSVNVWQDSGGLISAQYARLTGLLLAPIPPGS